MKTSEAPERLYLSELIYSTFQYQVPDPDDSTAVEYTRTDAFIEKAEKYLQEHLIDYWSQVITDESDFIDNFKSYMENE